MKKVLAVMLLLILCSMTACKKGPIEVSVSDLKKSLPDVAYNSADDNFFVFWAAAPDNESTTYYISGQKISSTGRKIGKPVVVLETANILAMPRALYNPHTNQYLVIYGQWVTAMNIYGVILDANGKAVGEHFQITTAGNQFHYTMALDSTKNQFFITYNDSRNGTGDIFGIILDETGAVVKKEFYINNSIGFQVNPFVCYNPQDKTYLVNWEDFRQYGDTLTSMGMLEVMTDIQGALLDDNGTVLLNDIEMCVDTAGENKDQRFNGIAYNSDKNEFLVTWTDTSASLQNIGIKGRIVKSDGSMPAGSFTVVDSTGAQMISHTVFVPEAQKYFVAFENDTNDLDDFYFKDLSAQLDISAQWLDDTGAPDGSSFSIYSGEGNQRFVRVAPNTRKGSFLLVWQYDFPGVSDTVNGHIMSNGGDIWGKIYKK